jgi:hypothetical protein
MAGLLDVFQEGGKFEGEVKASSAYLSSRRPSDFVAKVITFAQDVHKNDNAANFEEPYLRVEFEIVELSEIGAPLSRKIGKKQYAEAEGRIGDTFSVIHELSSTGLTKAQAQIALKDLAATVACLEGNIPDDYLPGGMLGLKGLADVMAKADAHVGKLVRFVCPTANAKGFCNHRMELVPADEPTTLPAKEEKKKKSA